MTTSFNTTTLRMSGSVIVVRAPLSGCGADLLPRAGVEDEPVPRLVPGEAERRQEQALRREQWTAARFCRQDFAWRHSEDVPSPGVGQCRPAFLDTDRHAQPGPELVAPGDLRRGWVTGPRMAATAAASGMSGTLARIASHITSEATVPRSVG